MAQKVETFLEDDLDGGPADETVEFSIDGKEFAVDLSAKNAQNLRDELTVYIQAGRRIGGRVKRGLGAAAGQASHNREHSQAVRAWARQNGYEISDRGRVPSNVAQAFEQAHQGSAA